MKKHIGFPVLVYFFLAAVFITYPLLFHLTDSVFGYGDEMLITWILNWNIHAFLTDPIHIFDATLYYPYKHTLAYSDTFFTSSVIAFLPILLFKEPILAYNIHVLFSLTTLGFFTYLLTRYLARDDFAGIVSGTLIAFSTFTLQRLPHLQIVSIQWIPLCLLFFLRYIQRKSFTHFVLANIFFLLQVANSPLPGYFTLFSIGLIVLYFYMTNRKQLEVFKNRKVFFVIILDVVLLLVLSFPYFQVSKEFGYVRDIRDTINFANRPEFTLYPNENTRFYHIFMDTFYPTKNQLVYDGYVGGMLSVLSVAGLLFFWKKRREYKNIYFRMFMWIAAGSYILSLGPALQWGGKVIKLPFIIPLPYAVFYYLIPGFKGIRNSGRWEMLTLLALSVAIGLMLSFLWRKVNIGKRLVITGIICGLVLLEFPFPRNFVPIETYAQFPAVYHYINTLPADTALVEFPFYNWNMSPYSMLENRRAFYSTLHHKKRMNGGSGFSPPEWQDRTYQFAYHFPDTKTITYLKTIKITHFILHKSEYDSMKARSYTVAGKKVKYWDGIQKELKKFSEVRLIKQFGNDYLYEIVYEK